MRRRGASTVAIWFAFLALAAGCTSTPAESCPPTPSDPTCPTPAPSFAAFVNPQVFQVSCVPCHNPTGEEARIPFTSYQQISIWATEIYNQVFEACAMPPPGAAQTLTDVQRQALLDWLACGAPGN